MIATTEVKHERAKELWRSFYKKAGYHEKERDSNLNDHDKWMMHHDKKSLYTMALANAIRLCWSIKEKKKAFQNNSTLSEMEYKAKLGVKEVRKARFESSFNCDVWFRQTSLDADYGTFSCDNCSSTFYHSPATIRKGKDIIHKCCCGTCTNSIMKLPFYN